MYELDSTTLYENGKKFLKLVDELENNIDYIYNRMDKMPFITGEWQGKAVSKFLNGTKKDKKEIKSFITALRNYGNNLIKQAEKIEICVNKVGL